MYTQKNLISYRSIQSIESLVVPIRKKSGKTLTIRMPTRASIFPFVSIKLVPQSLSCFMCVQVHDSKDGRTPRCGVELLHMRLLSGVLKLILVSHCVLTNVPSSYLSLIIFGAEFYFSFGSGKHGKPFHTTLRSTK